MDRGAAIDLVRELVAIPSISRHEARATEWLARQMRHAGYSRTFVDDAGNAVGEIGLEDAAQTIVLLGHIDTVPGNIPVRIEATTHGDVLYGRGSVDAKGPLAAFVAAGARVAADWPFASSTRIVVVGAVEEEAATSKGARFIAKRFDGTREPLPAACVIGEPSGWHRITLGYKGRLLLDLTARQPMAHTAGPDASIASVVVDIWNWVTMHAAAVNRDRSRAFDQLSPSLRRFVTSTTDDMIDTVDSEFAWRLPLGVDAERMVAALIDATATHLGAKMPVATAKDALAGTPVRFDGNRTSVEFRLRGWEHPWRGERQNALVRSFLHAIRVTAADAAAPEAVLRDGSSAQPGFVVKTGTSDMNVVGPVWRCPIVAYGPGDSALDHTPHEHLGLDEYWRGVQVVERMLHTFADAGP